jgi:exosortase
MILKESRTSLDNQETIFFFIVLIALILIFIPVYPQLYRDWFQNNNNSHGILVPIISIYLIWRQRKNIIPNDKKTSYFGLVILIAGLVFFVIGFAGRIAVLARLALVISINGLVLYNFGKKIYSVITFPLIFLIFMVPIPVSIENIVSLKLQMWVTDVSASVLNFFSIIFLQEGNILQFANCSLEVAEACGGIRSLIAYIMLGCLFAYMMNGTYFRRLLMVLIAIPLAFIINVARVVGTGVLANYFGEKIAKGFIHEFSGMVIFIVGFAFFIGLSKLIEKK